MYTIDVTKFRDNESEEGFPQQEKDEVMAWALFDRTVADLYSNANGPGSYVVTICVVGTGGEVPLRIELVNVPRK